MSASLNSISPLCRTPKMSPGPLSFKVIYQAIEDINAARVGMLAPEIVERDTGIAEVRDVFRVPKVGNIAGCYITEGEISRDDKVRVVRDSTVIFEGKISSLRRFKDDVKTVKQSYECGIGVEGYQDIKVGDVIEGFRIEEVERTPLLFSFLFKYTII